MFSRDGQDSMLGIAPKEKYSFTKQIRFVTIVADVDIVSSYPV